MLVWWSSASAGLAGDGDEKATTRVALVMSIVFGWLRWLVLWLVSRRLGDVNTSITDSNSETGQNTENKATGKKDYITTG